MLPRALSSLTDTLREVGYALPGASAALAALKAEPGVVQSAVTGNVIANARMKLAAFGLDEYLDLDVRTALPAHGLDPCRRRPGRMIIRNCSTLVPFNRRQGDNC